MSLTKLTENLNNVSNLPDKPSMRTDELKAVFDKAGNIIKKYINETLTEDIEKDLKKNKTETQALIDTIYRYEITLNNDIAENTDYVIPTTYTVGSGKLDVYYEGTLLSLSENYKEIGTEESQIIRFDWKVPKGSKLIFIVRK